MPSTSIRYFFYDELKSILKIVFIHGGTYEYTGVPKFIYEKMKKAKSKGRFFHDYIRDKYRYRRLDPV